MPHVTLRTAAGADAGSVELDDAMFGIQPNVPVMHQVVTAQLANRRAGTQSTKTRSEVRGGGAKPYRQKGTGNARQGSTSSPHYTGGGIALGPKPRSYRQRTPKKMIKLALRSALSDRAGDGKVVVVDEWSFAGPRTRDARQALAALGVEGRTLVVVDRFDSPTALSFRNLPDVQLIKVGELNAYDVLCNDWILFERALLPVSKLSDESTGEATEDTQEVDASAESTGEATDDTLEVDASAESTGEATDDTQVVTASAPDRSSDETEAGVASASEQPESSDEERSDEEEDHL